MAHSTVVPLGAAFAAGWTFMDPGIMVPYKPPPPPGWVRRRNCEGTYVWHTPSTTCMHACASQLVHPVQLFPSPIAMVTACHAQRLMLGMLLMHAAAGGAFGPRPLVRPRPRHLRCPRWRQVLPRVLWQLRQEPSVLVLLQTAADYCSHSCWCQGRRPASDTVPLPPPPGTQGVRLLRALPGVLGRTSILRQGLTSSQVS